MKNETNEIKISRSERSNKSQMNFLGKDSGFDQDSLFFGMFSEPKNDSRVCQGCGAKLLRADEDCCQPELLKQITLSNANDDLAWF